MTHLTAFSRLLARHGPRRSLADHKRTITKSSGRENAVRWVNNCFLWYDYVHLARESDILPWLEKGYGLRMSNPAKGIKALSLIMPGSIFKSVLLGPVTYRAREAPDDLGSL